MTDWSSPAVMAQAFYAATALMWLCIGIFGYDTLQYLPFDLSIIFGKRQRRWPQLPYLLSKLSTWSYLISIIVLVITDTEIDCRGTLYAIEAQMGLITVSSSMLLAFRAVCVFGGRTRKTVSVLLGVMTLGLLAAWMEGVNDIEAAWVAGGGNMWQEGACTFTHMSKQYAIKYIVTIIYDFVVMALTVVGVIRMNGGSRIGAVLVKQGFQYFLATFLINSLVAGLTLANLNPVMSLVCAIPSATVCVMCSTRLYVHLADEAKPNADGVDSLQLNPSSLSGSSVEKLTRFFKRSSQLHSSLATRSTASSKDATAVHSHGVASLSYGVQKDVHSSADVKSFGTTTSHDDLEAQNDGRNKGAAGIVNIIEERTVTQEPMPEHLAGVLYGQESNTAGGSGVDDTVQGHFPRLSKP
ncbi:hypothetical protein EX895_005359 [Sporisorium graminicola]|uniref:Uncharacterized protein n=1 Tax=Sporisorium graminicola TaxID=280036 RepID=A0A4U7KRI0_9BASI|nr:hypothetical protein EX895_005359 [Sporisorium graminicola]TKY85818.1 hypothetical protein EX895_005359 [Sporisorium graminicola]